MTEHGWPADDWPTIKHRVLDADICILGTPIWLGEKSSLAQAFIEKLYGAFQPDKRQGSVSFLR